VCSGGWADGAHAARVGRAHLQGKWGGPQLGRELGLVDG
jgi:hypothetical protein